MFWNRNNLLDWIWPEALSYGGLDGLDKESPLAAWLPLISADSLFFVENWTSHFELLHDCLVRCAQSAHRAGWEKLFGNPQNKVCVQRWQASKQVLVKLKELFWLSKRFVLCWHSPALSSFCSWCERRGGSEGGAALHVSSMRQQRIKNLKSINISSKEYYLRSIYSIHFFKYALILILVLDISVAPRKKCSISYQFQVSDTEPILVLAEHFKDTTFTILI